VSQVSNVQATCLSPIASSGATVRLVIAQADTIVAGAPLRVTRETRYAVYRAGDGTWQLGFREWGGAPPGFAAPQPVAGPLVFRSASRRSGFRYFDSAGVELVPSATPMDVSRLARIRLTMQTIAADRDRMRDSIRADSIDVAVRRATSP
jgi:hypothetical protein